MIGCKGLMVHDQEHWEAQFQKETVPHFMNYSILLKINFLRLEHY